VLDNEGHPGATINQISNFSDASLPDRPNIVLLHAGTNDLNNSPATDPYSTAPERLGALIDKIHTACPDATILVAQIINAASAATESRIKTFNAAIPDLVANRTQAGQHIAVVDMQSIGTADLVDGLHPTDAGYSKMGDIWFQAIKDAASKGWICPPVSPSS
jgi:lysophospholipase L1-like esterase